MVWKIATFTKTLITEHLYTVGMDEPYKCITMNHEWLCNLIMHFSHKVFVSLITLYYEHRLSVPVGSVSNSCVTINLPVRFTPSQPSLSLCVAL